MKFGAPGGVLFLPRLGRWQHVRSRSCLNTPDQDQRSSAGDELVRVGRQRHATRYTPLSILFLDNGVRSWSRLPQAMGEQHRRPAGHASTQRHAVSKAFRQQAQWLVYFITQNAVPPVSTQIDAIGIRSGAEDACTLVLDVREFVSDAVSNSDISGPSVAHR